MELDIFANDTVYEALDEALGWCETVSVQVLCTGPILSSGVNDASTNATMVPSLEPLAWSLTSLREAAASYQLLQIGICPFVTTQDSDGGKTVEARPFNVYVFPPEYSNKLVLSTATFRCEPKEMARLASGNLDFNRSFRYGLPYLSIADEAMVRRFEEEKQDSKEAAKAKSYKSRLIVPTESRDIAFCKVVKELLGKFVETESAAAASEAVQDQTLSSLEVSVDASENSLVLTAGNSYLRRLLHQRIDQFQVLHSRKTQSSDPRRPRLTVRLCEGGQAEVQRLEQERVENDRVRKEKEIQKAIGVRTLMQKLVDSKKTVVGCGVAAALMVIESIFVGRELLPTTVPTMREALYQRFPHVVDVCGRGEGVGVALSDAFQRYSSAPASMEAGYQALQAAVAAAALPDLKLCRPRLRLPRGQVLELDRDEVVSASVDRSVYVVSVTSPSPPQLDELRRRLEALPELVSIEGCTAASVFVRLKQCDGLKHLQAVVAGIGGDDGALLLFPHAKFVTRCNAAPLTLPAKRLRR